MDKNRISIIIPVYNAEDYLARCLDSIFEQSFASYEVILVDDGSTDSSPLICERYSSTDPRFRTVHKQNGGVGSARNAGMNLAKGEYLMFVDADDALLPDALEMVMENVSGEDLVVGSYTAFVAGVPGKENHPFKTRTYRGREIERFFDDNVRRGKDVLEVSWAKMFRRKTVGDLRFREDICYGEDRLFVLGFLASCKSVVTCNVPLYAWHIRPDALGSDVVSDRHLMQLRRFLPSYVETLDSLSETYPSSPKLRELYHREVVGKYCCRALKIFQKRKTSLLDKDYIAWIYGLMSRDESLRPLSFGFGNMFNIMLQRSGNVKRAMRTYRVTSFFS